MDRSLSDEQLDRAIYAFLVGRAEEIASLARPSDLAVARVDGVTQTRERVGRAASSRRVRGRRLLALAAVAITSLAIAAIWAAAAQQPQIAFAPGSIAFTRGHGDLYVAAPDGTDERLIASGAYTCCGADGTVRFAPDRQAIAFKRQTATRDEVVILAADGRTLATYPGGEGGQTQFAWAPDGKRLAVLGTAPDAVSAIIGLDGRVQRVLTFPDRWNMQDFWGIATASWSPDGHWIAVPGCVVPVNSEGASCWKDDQRFLLIAADGSGSHLLASDTEIEYSLAWAPDSRIALTRACGPTDLTSPMIVQIFPSAETQPRDIRSADCMEQQRVAWSPDGTRIAVTADYIGSGLLLIFGADGSSANPRNPVEEPPIYMLGQAAWSSDGRSLLYTGSDVPVDSNCCGEVSLWTEDVDSGRRSELIKGVDSLFDVASAR